MDKIYLKPTSHEISIKGASKEGRTDVFAYNYHDDDRRKLGGLYIVGNVKQDDFAREEGPMQSQVHADTEDSPDIAYVTNLVASLAKREYYSRLDISPHDAFLATLKKINGVVEEFFRNKSLNVNIGIFAIAGKEIMISKLGKFKIILGRPAHAGEEARAIDILNNVDLFNKEQIIEEKGFPNVISGKIMAGDKLFAFYPNRMITARERTIKADLLKADAGHFIDKINSIKETKVGFDCGAIYLSLDEHKEPSHPHTEHSSTDIKHTIDNREPVTSAQPRTVASGKLRDKHEDSRFNWNPDSSTKPGQLQNENVEVPKIISSEFSLGKKSNPLLLLIMAPVHMVRGLRRNINLKRKFVILSLVTGVLVISVVLVKMFVVVDSEQRQLNVVINQIQNNLKLAQTKISQNDLIGARQLLAESLSNIYAVGIKSAVTQKTADEIYAVLDNIDKAIDVSPTLLEAIPEKLNQRIAVINAYKGSGIALDIYENNLYILTNDSILKIANIDTNVQREPSTWLKSGNLPPQPTMLAVDGNIYIMNDSGTLSIFYKGEKVSDINTLIVSKAGDVLLTSDNSDKLYLVNKTLARIYELDKKDGSLVKTLKVGSSEPFVDAYFRTNDQGESIIITTKDGRIWEIK